MYLVAAPVNGGAKYTSLANEHLLSEPDTVIPVMSLCPGDLGPLTYPPPPIFSFDHFNRENVSSQAVDAHPVHRTL